MPDRTCSVDGCPNVHRARGLCSTHYNQRQPERHRKVELACGYCGAPTLKHRTAKFAERFCSMLCRDLWRIETGTNPDQWTALRANRSRLPKEHPARWIGAASVVPWRRCDECDGWYVGHRSSRRYCSNRCARRVKARATRARRRARWRALRLAVFERDGWQCHLCGEDCDPTLTVPDWAAPTVDHLVPSSLGGTDDMSNLATAHHLCNTLRGCRALGGYPIAA